MTSSPDSRYIPALDRSDWYTPDEHLRWLVRRSVGESLWPLADSVIGQWRYWLRALLGASDPVWRCRWKPSGR